MNEVPGGLTVVSTDKTTDPDIAGSDRYVRRPGHLRGIPFAGPDSAGARVGLTPTNRLHPQTLQRTAERLTSGP